ncbi:unnamed protein product [Rotaria sordida]|uniref:Uncharacterized protein n=1 Tax=Rotaria sordida TaxID=392033 RepID=A0A814ZDP7_9BILA|nr:unnamed protein product [Rotaria sordida]CAF1242445.1 unnamed protein product [Rotaria sordida]
MSIKRKSVFSSIARPSAVTIYSTTLYSNDEDDHRRLPRYYSAIYSHKADVYRVLERQQGRHTLIYHLFVFCLTLISLVFGSISTIDKWRSTLNKPLYYGELGLCIFFTYEFLLRIWSAGCLAKYRTWIGRLMFMTRSVIVLDILTLLGFALSISTGITTGEFPEIILKFLPLLQMIRFIRVDRQLTSWKILKGIILKHHQELTVTIVIGFMFLITGAYLVYIAETPVDPKLNTGSYKSMADSIWFSIITMTTIGFGDIFPKTYIGKIVTTTICYVGVAFWCLPVGIIGSGLAIKVQEQKRDDAFNRLIPAAASVIRNWWRLQCVYQGDRFVATWKIYTLMRRRVHVPVPSLTQDLSSTLTLMRSLSSNSYGTKSFPFNQANTTTIPKLNNVRRKSITSIEDLPKGYLTAIKIIRILKYSSSCKKFHQAKKPINLKDVVNENTQLNNRLSIILNDIQRRLDLALGTKKLASYLTDEQKRQLSLSSRIEKVEQITNQFETKLNYLERLALTLVEKQLK